MKYLLILVMLSGCGIKIETNDSTQKIVQDGSSFSYIVVRLEYIDQIAKLCQEANPVSLFATEELHKKAVADCTLEKMDILNINLNQVDDFNSAYCQEGADLSGFTPEQLLNIQEACQLLGSL